MFFCIKCKQQFGSHMSHYGECPYCNTINMASQKRKDIEANVLHENSKIMKNLQRLLDKRKLGR